MEFKYDRYVPKDFVANLHFRKLILERCGRDLKFRAFIKWVCERDFLFFVNVFVWTKNPKAVIRRIPFICYPYQEDFFRNEIERLEERLETGACTIDKSRTMGATWIIIILFYLFWKFSPANNSVDLGLTSRKATLVDDKSAPNTLFAKFDYVNDHLPPWFRTPVESKLFLRKNKTTGSTLVGETTTGDMFRAGRLDAIGFDEFAFVDPKDADASLSASAEVSDFRYFFSTPNGPGTSFLAMVKTAGYSYKFLWVLHPLYRKGLYTSISSDGGKTYKLKLLDTSHRGWELVRRRGQKSFWRMFPDDYPFILDGEERSPWFDRAEAEQPDDMKVAQELKCDHGGSVYRAFDPKMIDAYIANNAIVPLRTASADIHEGEFSFDMQGKTFSFWFDAFSVDERGRFTIDPGWLYGKRFVVGSDLALGSGAANSVTCIYDFDTREKVAVYRNSTIKIEDFAALNVWLCKTFNNAFHIYDATGYIAQPYWEHFEKAKGDADFRVYRRESGLPGYHLNSDARSALLENYRVCLGQNMIVNRSEIGLNECLEFITEPGGIIVHSSSKNSKDPSGAREAHGDEVIGDSLCAVVLTGEMVESRELFSEKIEVPVGSVAWMIEQEKKESTEDGMSEYERSLCL